MHECKADIYLRSPNQSALLSAVCNHALYAGLSGAVSRDCPGYLIKRVSVCVCVCVHTAPLSSLFDEILNWHGLKGASEGHLIHPALGRADFRVGSGCSEPWPSENLGILQNSVMFFHKI